MISILYIDDDPEDIEIFEEAVKVVDPSIEYTGAASGREALEFLNAGERLPDYIFLDINMHEMDGKCCLQLLRQDKKFDHINIIVYSTNSLHHDLADIESLGATFLKKVNSFDDLCAIIRNLAERR